MQMIKKSLKSITPFVVIILLVIIGMGIFFKKNSDNPLNDFWFEKTIVFVIAAVAIDSVLRYLFKTKKYFIWIIEALLLLAAVYAWIVA